MMETITTPMPNRVYERHPVTVVRTIQRGDYTVPEFERHLFVNGRNNEEIIMTSTPKKTSRIYKRRLALLIAAHNEELVIEQTIRSAIRAGMKPENIYVVDDNSSDSTSKIVRSILGRDQLLRVKRSGKGLALSKATKKFKLTQRYEWIHIADADGGFASDYFKVFRSTLDPKFAAATGYVRSLPGGSVSQYRVMEYTLGLEIHRRFQALVHTVPVIPGPTSCFRADVFAKLNFANHSMTEDFDVTLQLHRQKLGRIQYIPNAVAYTQDPKTTGDYVKQITRWNRGMLQAMHHHQIGKHVSRIDAYLTYQMMQNLMFFAYIFVIIPLLIISKHNPDLIANVFIWDVSIIFIVTLATALRARRLDILSAFPQIYILRWISAGVFLRSFVEVMILRKYRITNGVWGTSGRRYKSETNLLSV